MSENQSTTTAYERIVNALEANGCRVKDNGHGRTQAQCPSHADDQPSLSVSDGDRRALLYCHAGCDTENVLAAIGLTRRDMFDDPRGISYVYADGRIVDRTPHGGKDFKQRGTKDGNALYGIDTITATTTTVYITEGESDAANIAKLCGVAAVSPPMGAGKDPQQWDWKPLRAKHIRQVIVVADRDDAGRNHANAIAAHLAEYLTATVTLAEPVTGKDVSDHIAAGHSLDELVTCETPSVLKLWHATDLMDAKQVEWLASKRIPRGFVSLLVGEEGIGKSLFWALLVGAVTRGIPLPYLGIPQREPQYVTLVLTEDDWQSVVKPRLIMSDTDFNYVNVLCCDSDGTGTPTLPDDCGKLIRGDGLTALVIVDAWLDTVTGKLSVRDSQQARAALHPLKQLAARSRAAIVLTCHTNRESTTVIRDKYGATGELRKVARVTLFAQLDDTRQYFTIGPEKNNLAPTVNASMFTIEAKQYFDATDDDDGHVAYMKHVGESDNTAEQQHAANHDSNDRKSRTADVDAWLTVQLKDGPRWSNDVIECGATEQGYSKDQLFRARKRLKIEAKLAYRGDNTKAWYWRLPEHFNRVPGEAVEESEF